MTIYRMTVEFESSRELIDVENGAQVALEDEFPNVVVLRIEKLTLTPEQAIKKIQKLIDKTGPITYIEPNKIQSILDHVVNF